MTENTGIEPQSEFGPLPYGEDDLLPISALQHLSFCERQCALIHLEGVWAENRLTAEGRIMHERVHEADSETRHGVRTTRGLRLRSLRLGLIGIADVVEFHGDHRGILVDGIDGRWRVFPIEYKRGKPKSDLCDEVQLCAQAMCLEEMLACDIQEGALFYGKQRRRKQIVFSPFLRNETEALARRLHNLFASGKTPPALFENKCKQCSLVEACMPRSAGHGKSASGYLRSAVDAMLQEE
jgi:CRISPR-associated exonuclease Cas4